MRSLSLSKAQPVKKDSHPNQEIALESEDNNLVPNVENEKVVEEKPTPSFLRRDFPEARTPEDKELFAGEDNQLSKKEKFYQEKRRELLQSPNVDGYIRLAFWCKKQDMPDRCNRLLEQVLLLEPNHAKVRKELGYHRIQNHWVTEKQANRSGFYQYQGKWEHRNTLTARGLQYVNGEWRSLHTNKTKKEDTKDPLDEWLDNTEESEDWQLASDETSQDSLSPGFSAKEDSSPEQPLKDSQVKPSIPEDILEKMEKFNEAFGRKLFSDTTLWSEDPENIADRFDLSIDAEQAS
jgi:hypothetical protein